ncbi:MAG: hypoxanthine phosphoribosyltransferase [Deltaproteobacteria bacterium]
MDDVEKKPVLKPLLSAERIRARVEELARNISADYAGRGELFLVGVLRGSFMFLADLVRRLTVPVRIDFLALSAYPDSDSFSGEVRLLLDLRHPIAGRHVLVVEDIVDTGATLRFLLDNLRTRGPASLATCALLRKPDRLRHDTRIEYVGFDIPDVWVVGYGLDLVERYRELSFIGSIG